jgi:hypothetical protein
MGVGRLLIIAGALLIVAGLLIHFGGRFFGLGKLPGDIVVRRTNFTFYFPIMTSIILSVILTVVMWLFSRR